MRENTQEQKYQLSAVKSLSWQKKYDLEIHIGGPLSSLYVFDNFNNETAADIVLGTIRFAINNIRIFPFSACLCLKGQPNKKKDPLNKKKDQPNKKKNERYERCPYNECRVWMKKKTLQSSVENL